MPAKNYGTIKIPREDFERHNERRKERNLTWVQYLDGESPEAVDVDGIEQELRKLQELVERVPEDTADEIEDSFR